MAGEVSQGCTIRSSPPYLTQQRSTGIPPPPCGQTVLMEYSTTLPYDPWNIGTSQQGPSGTDPINLILCRITYIEHPPSTNLCSPIISSKPHFRVVEQHWMVQNKEKKTTLARGLYSPLTTPMQNVTSAHHPHLKCRQVTQTPIK